MTRRSVTTAATAFVALLGIAASATATEYFVDFDATPGASCSDAGPGTDPRTGGTPWCTLPGTHATSFATGFLPGPWIRVHASDTVSIKAGSVHTSTDGAGAVLIDPSHYDSGTAGARIVIRKHPTWGTGTHAVFDGTGMTTPGTGIVTVYAIDYLTLDGLEIHESSGIAIDIEHDAHHVLIDNAYVHDGYSQTALIVLVGCTTNPCMQVVRNSTVSNAHYGGGIFVYDNPGGHVLVENNVLHHICGGFFNYDALECGALDGATNYCAFRNNVVYAHGTHSGYADCPYGGSDPIDMGGNGCHHHAFAEGNEVYDASGRFLVHGPYEDDCEDGPLESYNIARRNRLTNLDIITYKYPSDTIFYNNTLYNPGTGNDIQIYTGEAEPSPGTSFGTPEHLARVQAIGHDVDFGRLTFKNNLMWGQTSYHALLNGSAGFRVDARYSSFRIYYNLYRGFVPLFWYPSETAGFAYYGTATAFQNSRVTDAPDVGSIFSNAPESAVFVDAPHRDFHLPPGSPAIDAGTAITNAVGASAGASGSVNLHVERASFVDGYEGLFEPDHITVGDCLDVEIAHIDDFTATILLASPCRWSDGDPVNLASQGHAPDIGAFEVAAVPAPTPTPLTTPATTPTAVPAICGNGVLEPSESCDDGNTNDGDCCSSTCRIDVAGTLCDDGNACTNETVCSAGACSGGLPTSCPACKICQSDVGCIAAPRSGCHQPTARFSGLLQLVDRTTDKLSWTWAKGSATTLADFGNPVGGDAYTLCLYDESGATPHVALRAVTRSGQCGSRPCWKRFGATAFRYKDATQISDGLDAVLLKSGTDGKAKILVNAKGSHLALPPLPVGFPLRMQLQAASGQCWEARYFDLGTSTNDARYFKAKAFLPPLP